MCNIQNVSKVKKYVGENLNLWIALTMKNMKLNVQRQKNDFTANAKSITLVKCILFGYG